MGSKNYSRIKYSKLKYLRQEEKYARLLLCNNKIIIVTVIVNKGGTNCGMLI